MAAEWAEVEVVHSFADALEVAWPGLEDSPGALYCLEIESAALDGEPRVLTGLREPRAFLHGVGQASELTVRVQAQASQDDAPFGTLVDEEVGASGTPVSSARLVGPWCRIIATVCELDLDGTNYDADPHGQARGPCGESGCVGYVSAESQDPFAENELLERCFRCGLHYARHGLLNGEGETQEESPSARAGSDAEPAESSLNGESVPASAAAVGQSADSQAALAPFALAEPPRVGPEELLPPAAAVEGSEGSEGSEGGEWALLASAAADAEPVESESALVALADAPLAAGWLEPPAVEADDSEGGEWALLAAAAVDADEPADSDGTSGQAGAAELPVPAGEPAVAAAAATAESAQGPAVATDVPAVLAPASDGAEAPASVSEAAAPAGAGAAEAPAAGAAAAVDAAERRREREAEAAAARRQRREEAAAAAEVVARRQLAQREEEEDEEDDEDEDEDLRLMLDVQRVLRGRCLACSSCRAWRKATGPFAHRTCLGCKCRTEDHEDLSGWMEEVLDRSMPSSACLLNEGIPLQAYKRWSPLETRLHLESGAAFDPGLHGRGATPATSSSSAASRRRAASSVPTPQRPLCSVICPTTADRQAFHPLLLRCFSQQSYQPKELVVIDTGPRPSTLLSDRARRDPSVVYRWFDSGRWSIGLKRNLACFLARGEVIAHFDDDDLYTKDYLASMVGQLLQASAEDAPEGEADSAAGGAETAVVAPSGASASPASRPVAATLATWHVFDVDRRIFRVVHAVADRWVYGWGFSFAYTKEAWRRRMFPHMDVGEDFDFMMALKSMPEAKVLVVDEAGPICSHTYHPEVSISGGENRGNTRDDPIGQEVQPPEQLLHLLPTLLDCDAEAMEICGRKAPPPEAEYSYYLLGSWSKWEKFDELQHRASVFEALVPLYYKHVEFQVCANRDQSLCYYPTKGGRILGPWRCPGAHWTVSVPADRSALLVTWDPKGSRSLRWSFTTVQLPPRPGSIPNGTPVTVEIPEWGSITPTLVGHLCSAAYGAGDTWVDVRERVQHIFRKGRSVVVMNDNFGCDPCAGCKKTLRMTYVPRDPAPGG